MSMTESEAWAKIEKSASEFVAKSAESISKEQSVERFLRTREGAELYTQYVIAKGVY